MCYRRFSLTGQSITSGRRMVAGVAGLAEGGLAMKKARASSFALFAGLTLMFALGMVPALTMAQVTRSIVGDWSGTLDPGAQPKKRIVVHISAAQDGTL